MNAEAFTAERARLVRWRVPAPLIRTFPWYRALDQEQRYQAEERLGLSVGTMPCNADAWLLVRAQLGLQHFPAIPPG